MITENIISIWSGNFKSEKEFYNHLEEIFDKEGDSSSKFMEDFKIDFIDNQFQEAVYFNELISLDSLKDASYSESFLNKLSNSDFENKNAIIIIYDFKYSGIIKKTEHLIFLGDFIYSKE